MGGGCSSAVLTGSVVEGGRAGGVPAGDAAVVVVTCPIGCITLWARRWAAGAELHPIATALRTRQRPTTTAVLATSGHNRRFDGAAPGGAGGGDGNWDISRAPGHVGQGPGVGNLGHDKGRRERRFGTTPRRCSWVNFSRTLWNGCDPARPADAGQVPGCHEQKDRASNSSATIRSTLATSSGLVRKAFAPASSSLIRAIGESTLLRTTIGTCDVTA